MSKSVLVSAIEGEIVKFEGDYRKFLQDKDGDIEDLEYWLQQNLPQVGTSVRIEVMSFPED